MTAEDRIARLEGDAAIRQLVARYAFHLDHREMEGLHGLFAPDGKMASVDGRMNADGPDAIVAMFARRFEVLGPGSHYMHDIQIDFEDADHASGRVSGHAELLRSGEMFVTAMRYDDRYVRTAAGWRFASRLVSFLYYVPVTAYAGILGRRDRNWAYGEPVAAEFPETLPNWQPS